MIFALPNAFPKELIAEIREKMSTISVEPDNAFGGAYNRMGKTVSFHLPELQELDAKISSFISNFSQEFIKPHYQPPVATSDSGYEYHKYGIGQGCLVHADQEFNFPNGARTSLLRFATVVVHLNTVNEGGETVFPNQNKQFKTIEGQILVFPPYGGYPHYVTPCVDVEREILMTWFVYTGINAVIV